MDCQIPSHKNLYVPDVRSNGMIIILTRNSTCDGDNGRVLYNYSKY